MKIALLGYGKMGKMIEHIAQQRGHIIVAKIDSHSPFDIKDADVAIDFSSPECAFSHIKACAEAKKPIICGTTGWTEKWDLAVNEITKNDTAMVFSSNFSMGVNIFFELNEYLSKLIAPYPQYNASVTETHHIHKKDAPSGTAITLCDGILSQNNKYKGWVLDNEKDTIHDDQIKVTSIREGEVPGTHSICYDNAIDSIEICHTAHSREGFALGAVIAAEWIINKKGLFSMKDVIFNDKNK